MQLTIEIRSTTDELASSNRREDRLFVSRYFGTKPETLDRMARNKTECVEVLLNIAEHRNTSSETQEYLAETYANKHGYFYVMHRLALREPRGLSVSQKALGIICETPRLISRTTMKSAISYCSNAPFQYLDKLRKDPDTEMGERASRSMLEALYRM